MKTQVSIVKCGDYDYQNVEKAVRRSVDLNGGIKKYIKPGERILLKPNLLSARLPERAITTHPAIVRAAARLVREAGAVPVIGDSPGGAIKGVERVWTETGMKKLADEEGIELINFETTGSIEKPINHPNIPTVTLSKAILGVDGIINLPKLKTHGLLIYTGAIKNLYGCIPGLRKAEYHKMAPHPDDFGHFLGEIYLSLKNKIRFTLIDGIMGMEGNGPSSGKLRKLDMVLFGQNAVALDTAVTYILGFKPEKIDMINYFSKSEDDVTNISKINIVGDSLNEFNTKGFKFPSNWYINLMPHFVVKILGSFIWMKPQISASICKNCKICVQSCPVQAITQANNDIPFVQDKVCISCLCCHEMCPYDAIELKSSALSKLFIRQK